MAADHDHTDEADGQPPCECLRCENQELRNQLDVVRGDWERAEAARARHARSAERAWARATETAAQLCAERLTRAKATTDHEEA